jgi:hypothetical protein
MHSFDVDSLTGGCRIFSLSEIFHDIFYLICDTTPADFNWRDSFVILFSFVTCDMSFWHDMNRHDL